MSDKYMRRYGFTQVMVILLVCAAVGILFGCKVNIMSIQAPGYVKHDSEIVVRLSGVGHYKFDNADGYGVIIEVPQDWDVLDANATAQVLTSSFKYNLERNKEIEGMFISEPGYKTWAASASQSGHNYNDVNITVDIKIKVGSTIGTFWVKAVAMAHRGRWVSDDPFLVNDFSAVTDAAHRSTITVQRFPLPDSGQQKCYDNDWDIVCPSKYNTFFGQDAQYRGPMPRYRDNDDGIITDLVTGIEWMQDTADTNNDGSIDEDDMLTWQEAKDYCDGLAYSGKDDWHLPDFTQLMSIIDFDSMHPSIDQNYFRCVKDLSAPYWTSNSFANDPNSIWSIGFYIGKVLKKNSTSTAYVRCVRGYGPYEPGHYKILFPGLILDLSTGLVWMRSPADLNGDGQYFRDDDTLQWSDALDYCERLVFAGYDDWRLPSVREFLSLLDVSLDPSINPAFELAVDENHLTLPEWTSTSRLLPNAYLAWLSFKGTNFYSFKNRNSVVRCVRGGLMPPGDFDADGDVDGEDLLRLCNAYVQDEYDHVCDMDHDGRIARTDLYLWASDFGHEL